MEYLKCLWSGAIGMVLAVLALTMIILIVDLGMMGLECLLGLFGARSVLPPDVSRGSIIEPIASILFALIVLPCLGWLFRRHSELLGKDALRKMEIRILSGTVANLRRELASTKTTT